MAIIRQFILGLPDGAGAKNAIALRKIAIVHTEANSSASCKNRGIGAVKYN
jgi:hypothetical protein